MPESGLTVTDLAGLSEPACKLIDALRATTGVLFEPARIRRKAKADADAAIVEAKANFQIKELERRAFERIKTREARRQENIENIVNGATQQLPPNSPGKTLDEDWVSEFMNHCQDIRDEQMQQVWSRILAGEFSSPGKYSLRTLNFVKLLSKKDAELFSRFCSFLWFTGSEFAYLKTKQTEEYLAANGFPYAGHLHLQSLGLVNMELTLSIKFSAPKAILRFYGQPYRFEFPEGTAEPSISCVCLTNIGKELTSLCTSKPSLGYVTALIESLKAENAVTISPVK
jgi:uncharacterized repeat protein (TIGR03899 family)